MFDQLLGGVRLIERRKFVVRHVRSSLAASNERDHQLWGYVRM
jgi:hypothetical protein